MFSMLDDLRREFDRFFMEAETLLPMPAATATGTGWTAFVPPVDINETDKDYIVSAEVPGIDPKEIDIRLEGNTLIIRGERTQQSEQDIGMIHRSERSFGSFSRAFTLPQDAMVDGIAAKFCNGVLSVTVPKSQAQPSKQVPIQAEGESAQQISGTGTPAQVSMPQGQTHQEAPQQGQMAHQSQPAE
jgi:HSP20 family protein